MYGLDAVCNCTNYLLLFIWARRRGEKSSRAAACCAAITFTVSLDPLLINTLGISPFQLKHGKLQSYSLL